MDKLPEDTLTSVDEKGNCTMCGQPGRHRTVVVHGQEACAEATEEGPEYTNRPLDAMAANPTEANDTFDKAMVAWIERGTPDEICGCGHETADHTLRGDCAIKDCHNAAE